MPGMNTMKWGDMKKQQEAANKKEADKKVKPKEEKK